MTRSYAVKYYLIASANRPGARDQVLPQCQAIAKLGGFVRGFHLLRLVQADEDGE